MFWVKVSVDADKKVSRCRGLGMVGELVFCQCGLLCEGGVLTVVRVPVHWCGRTSSVLVLLVWWSGRRRIGCLHPEGFRRCKVWLLWAMLAVYRQCRFWLWCRLRLRVLAWRRVCQLVRWSRAPMLWL